MSELTNEDIFQVVVKHLTDIADDIDPADVKREHSMKELGASSLDIVEVVSCSIRELRVRIPRNELNDLKTIGELVDLLEKTVKEKQMQAN